jgi:hypothetical protein
MGNNSVRIGGKLRMVCMGDNSMGMKKKCEWFCMGDNFVNCSVWEITQ